MIKFIIIALAVFGILFKVILGIVKYRSANNPTPENLKDVYDEETYEKWKKYSAEHCRLSLVSSVISCIITLALLSTNAYAAFASLFPSDNIHLQLIAVIILEVVVSAVVGAVESYVSTMVIEQKYGFNRSSFKTFIFDVIRSLIVNFLLSLALSELMTLFLFGEWIIIVFAAVVFAATMLITFIYPYLSRIGNKFTPLEEGELKEKLMNLLLKHGYQVKAIEVMDASRRTTKLNAYIAGFGKTKTIVLYDNLVERMTVDEICAIFAHELGHGLHKDVLKSQILNIGNIALISLVVLLAVSQESFYTEFGFNTVNFGFAYILTSIGLGVVQPFTSLIINARSRAAEYAADRQAVIEGYGEPMISAFKKLAKDNFANLSPSRINVVLEYSHPPIHSRVEAVEKAMAELDRK